MPGQSGSFYDSDVAAWVDWNDQEHLVPDGQSIRDVADWEDVQGVRVHTWNVDDPRDEHWFYVWTYSSLDWDEWDDAIDGNMDMHNMAFA